MKKYIVTSDYGSYTESIHDTKNAAIQEILHERDIDTEDLEGFSIHEIEYDDTKIDIDFGFGELFIYEKENEDPIEYDDFGMHGIIVKDLKMDWENYMLKEKLQDELMDEIIHENN